jgi:hypothetical protein
MEMFVGAHGPEEQALGWYTYLEGPPTFPLVARCVNETVRLTSASQR